MYEEIIKLVAFVGLLLGMVGVIVLVVTFLSYLILSLIIAMQKMRWL